MAGRPRNNRNPIDFKPLDAATPTPEDEALYEASRNAPSEEEWQDSAGVPPDAIGSDAPSADPVGPQGEKGSDVEAVNPNDFSFDDIAIGDPSTLSNTPEITQDAQPATEGDTEGDSSPAAPWDLHDGKETEHQNPSQFRGLSLDQLGPYEKCPICGWQFSEPFTDGNGKEVVRCINPTCGALQDVK